jgi:hypothetical protein
LDERSNDSHDPSVFIVQPGIRFALNDIFYLQQAFAWYDFINVKNNVLDNTAGSNARSGSGLLMYDYDAINATIEIGLKNAFHDHLPLIAIYADYINNVHRSSDDEGFLAGVRFGDEKVKTWRQWQAKLQYRRLEQDAWLDTMPDSDAYGGETGVKGIEAILEFGLKKNMYLALDYYYMERIRKRNRSEKRLQVDMNFKF